MASTLASFKVPKVVNEPNVRLHSYNLPQVDRHQTADALTTVSKQHHYAKGSAQRAGLTAAIESLRQKVPLEVPLVIGGKEVHSL